MGRASYRTGKTWRKRGARNARSPSTNDALPREDRLGDARGHLLVAVDERHQEPQVLLGAPEVVPKCCAPLLTVRLKRVLEVRLFYGFLEDVRREDRGPAVG